MFRVLIFRFALSVLPLLSGASAQQSAALGDVDGDGVATVRDIALVAGYFSGTGTLSETQRQLADVNRDGTVNEADMEEVVREILGTRTPEKLPLSTVRSTSPAAGEANVAVTRETVVYFTVPLALSATLDTTKFHAEFGGRKILSRAEISSDRKKATLFYLQPLPSNARIRGTLDTAGLTDILNRPVDGDGDGAGGGIFSFSFDTLSITPVSATAISGRVIASERGTGGVETPLAGVTVTVDGAEESLRTVTNSQGNFTLSPCPAGTFFVRIDGRTSPRSTWPGGSYYPVVGKKWHALAGRTDNLSGDAPDPQRGTVYLPLVTPGTLETVSATTDTRVDFPPAVLAASPGLAGTELLVPANSLFSDDGVRGGRVGIAPVAPDRLPSPLPPGLNLPLVITIQTDGGTNFDRPVPVSFPNTPDPATGKPLPPGAKSALWSFDHDTGEWEIAGSMTVTEDGKFVKSDPGTGVRQPGWHGQSPGCEGNGGEPIEKPEAPPCDPDFWDALELAEKFIADAYDCAKDLSPAKIPKALLCFAEALKILLDIKDRVSVAKDLIDAFYLESDKKKGVIYLERASVVVGLIHTTLCEDLETKLECVRDGAGAARKLKAVMSCVDAIISIMEDICDMEDGACSKSTWFHRNVCPIIPHIRAFYDYLKSYEQMAEDLEKNLLKAVTCAAVDHLRISLEEALAIAHAAGGAKGGMDLNVPLSMALADIDMIQSEGDGFNRDKMNLDRAIVSFDGLDRDILTTLSGMSMDLMRAGKKRERRVHYLIWGENFEFRGMANANGAITRVMPADSFFHIEVFDSLSGEIGHSVGKSVGNGQVFKINPIRFSKDESQDRDKDNLSDHVEWILETNPDSADTDSDGISDDAELKNGGNPLDGQASAEGVLASVQTEADLTNISASNNLAAVAMGGAGVSVFNVFSGLNPTRILDVDTPGNAVAVACAGDFVCVADEGAGLAVIDAGNPADIRLAWRIPLGAVVSAVACDGVTAYAGTGRGEVVAADLATGLILGRTQTGGGTPEDMGTAGDMLYVLDAGALRIFRLENGLPAAAGSLPLELTRGNMNLRFRLFCDGKTAYCAHSRGYNIVDVGNPAQPRLIQNYQDGQFGWKQVTANGSGLGIVAASPNSTPDGPHDLNLYNFGADGRGTGFLTTIVTPGLARAVSLYNGFAYVADSEAGLQVINYLPFDSKKTPPVITLSSNFNLAGGRAEEGKRMRLTAAVTDDVQVRNVEFYVNGALRATDGNYPFESAFLTPAIASGAETFKVRAKATDTGGNMTWTEEFTLTLTPDATPPAVVASSPVAGQLTGALREVWVKFNEPMAEATLAAGLKVTLNGTEVPASASYREAANTAFLSFAQPLSPGAYQLSAMTSVTDAAGNGLAAPLAVNFRVFSLRDDDADGMPDDWENLLGLDKTKADSNGNGIRDGDEDFDGDGLANGLEILAGMDPSKPDTNGNGIPDGLEDSDLDGLTDGREIVLGTDRFKPDTDDDTWSDEAEVSAGSDPLNPRSRPYPFMMQALQVTALSPGRPGGGMLSTVAASPPPVTALRLDFSPAGAGNSGGGLSNGVLPAGPPVTVVRFGSGGAGAGGSVQQAEPPVTVLRHGSAAADKPGSGLMAQPPVTVRRNN